MRALKVGDGLSYTWRDITDRVQLNERYRLLAENASDVVYETDPEGLIRWMSPSTYRVLSWQPSDLLGLSSFDFIVEDDRAKVRSHNVRALRGDYPDAVEARYRSAQGDEHWMSVSARPIRTTAGAVEAIVVGLRGIDAEVATRHSLATSESHFRLLAENSTDVVLETDYEGTIKWVSPSVQQVLGWLPVSLGTRSNDLIVAEDVAKVNAWRHLVRLGERIDDAQVRVKTSSGDVRWMAVRARPARDGTGRVVGGVVGMRDCQSEVVAQRAANTLSAGSQVLVRSEREEDLLAEMCQAAVDEGGYLLAWYARRIEGVGHLVEKAASSSDHRDYVESIEVDWSTRPLARDPSAPPCARVSRLSSATC